MATKPYRPKTRVLERAEFYATYSMLFACIPIVERTANQDASVWMLDDDLLPTQTIANVRWIMHGSRGVLTIFQVDNAGDAILLVRGD